MPELISLTDKDYRVTSWCGGTTTELLIFPEDGSFADRNFACRLSTAKILESGPYTPLPGVRRVHMPIGGNGICLTTDSHASPVMLSNFEQCEFDGAEKVSCELRDGPVTAFNVMLVGKAQAKLEALLIEDKYRFDSQVGKSSPSMLFIYCVDTPVEITSDGFERELCLLAGHSCCLASSTDAVYLQTERTSTRLIVVSIPDPLESETQP